ncbi:MAG TPA: hypothetical protein VFG04_16030 [Planctomycetaceae bacterium]|jgi:hypothetical protein|nr:hypothetical protein [Planctomycetaceae bacterium]
MSDPAHLPPLTPAQQAQWVATLQSVEYHESDLSTDLLGAGLWIAYAALALFWFRAIARRQALGWLRTAREQVVIPAVARYRARALESARELEMPRPRVYAEPAAQI